MEKEGENFNISEVFDVCRQQFSMGQYSKCVERLRHCHAKLIDIFNHDTRLTWVAEKSQLTIIKWCTEHNIILCELLEGKNADNEIACKQFYQFLLDIQGISPVRDSLLVEMSALYNWISSLLFDDRFEPECSRNEILLHINGAVKRFFLVLTGSNPSFMKDEINGLLSLIEGIFQHFNDMMKEEKRIFLFVCCGISWFLTHQGNIKESLFLLNMISLHIDKCNKSQNGEIEMTRFIWTNNSSYSQIPTTDWTDVIKFTHLYCLLIQEDVNHSNCAEYFEKVIHIPFFQYLNALTYFKEGQYSKVIDITQSLSSSSSMMEGWLKAKICNLIGCCYSLLGKHQISKEWFAQAVNKDIGCLLSLKNLSVQFRLLEKHDREMEVLQLLVKAAASFEKEQKRMNSSSVSYTSLLYLLSKRYFDLHQYEEAAKWFDYLLKLFDEKFIYQFGQCSDISTIPELQVIYHQAAYSYLNIRKYDKCIDICQKAVDSYCCGNNVTASLYHFERGTKSNTLPDETRDVGFYIDSKETSALLQQLSLDVVALLMRSAAFYHSDRKDQALLDMKRVRSALMSKNSAVMVKGDSSSNTVTKRTCHDDMRSIESEEASKGKTILDYLMSQVLNNLAILCVEQTRHQEAIHLFRIALSCFPVNTDAAYNSAILMATLGHKTHATQTWKRFKMEKKENNSYLSAVPSEQLQKLEQTINSLRSNDNIQSKLVISDKWTFSTYSYNVELDFSSSLLQIYMPLYVNPPLLSK